MLTFLHRGIWFERLKGYDPARGDRAIRQPSGRDCCEAHVSDAGAHTVCALMTAEFLEFSKSRGNDLSTPRPEFGFAGLKPGDRWCLCAARWREAYEAGSAPKIVMRATHREAATIVPYAAMLSHAVDSN